MSELKTQDNKKIVTNPNQKQWTLTNMVITKGLVEFLEALDTFVILSRTPNPIRRNGILVIGDYGCGKTIMVEAAMNDKKYNEYFCYQNIKGMFTRFDHKEVDKAITEIFNNAILEKERLGTKFAVLFIDEISSSIGTRKRASRVQKILIDAILRALTSYPNVVLIGTANDIYEADESIIHSGRFTIIYLRNLIVPKERTLMLKAHIDVVLSYVEFAPEITNNLIIWESFHKGWSGRDFEDWTVDVSIFYELNNKKRISLEDFKELLSKRNDIIQRKKEEIDNITRQLNPLCIYCGGESKKMGFYKGHQRFICKQYSTCGRSFQDIEINDEVYKKIFDLKGE